MIIKEFRVREECKIIIFIYVGVRKNGFEHKELAIFELKLKWVP